MNYFPLRQDSLTLIRWRQPEGVAAEVLYMRFLLTCVKSTTSMLKLSQRYIAMLLSNL